jgi:hypothetical protein
MVGPREDVRMVMEKYALTEKDGMDICEQHYQQQL